MVLPVITRGMMEPSAMRRFSIPIDSKSGIHNGHGVLSHLGSACLMEIALDTIADEGFELRTFQVAWHHLPLGERPKRSGVPNLAAQLNAGYRSFQIVGI